MACRCDVADMVYAAIFDGMGSMQSHFSGPRILQAEKILHGIDMLVQHLDDPAKLQKLTEVLAFQHIHLETTVARVHVFRDCVLELLSVELGDANRQADSLDSFRILFNYVGGAMIYVRATYQARLNLVTGSWSHANDKVNKDADAKSAKMNHFDSMSNIDGTMATQSGGGPCSWLWYCCGGGGSGHHSDGGVETLSANGVEKEGQLQQTANSNSAGGMQHLPTTFDEMFSINSRVMGLTDIAWMDQVVNSFDAIVRNVSCPARVQEEVEIIALNITKNVPLDTVNLDEFKSCMLASLRSLLPKIWTTDHEVAWSWMWGNVAHLLERELGKSSEYEKDLSALQALFTDTMRYKFFQATYDRFFELAPAGQEYFKQSSTRLNFIAERVFQITMDMLSESRNMVDDISALGLKHVGFGVPTELFSPFIAAWVLCLKDIVPEDLQRGLIAFRWSAGLVSKILIRTISEGSTAVMKAINSNSPRMLKKALTVAPRRDRALWMLLVEVGTQSISPLEQAIENARMDVATAIIEDLLTIRADRDRYYYGVDHLFSRHPDLVVRLCQSAPMLLPTLLQGLVWRSHRPKDGYRRVNYFIEHMVISKKGKFADALKAVVSTGDPSLISNDVLVSISDMLWNRIVHRDFVRSKAWNVALLIIFVLGVGVLPNLAEDMEGQELARMEIVIFVARLATYVGGIGRLVYVHISHIWHWCKMEMQRIFEEIDEDGNGDIDWEEFVMAIGKFRDLVQGKVVKAISVFREDPEAVVKDDEDRPGASKSRGSTLLSISLFVCLVSMSAYEPFLYCVGAPDWPTSTCDSAMDIKRLYRILASTAMIVHWFALIDLSVFSTELSAFLLVVNHVLMEVQQFLTALCFLLLTFGSALTILCRDCTDEGGTFSDMFNAMASLFAMVLRLYQGDFRDMEENPLLLAIVLVYVTLAAVLALNLLVAQLNLSYAFIYRDMLGFALLKRASLIVTSMDRCGKRRWAKFVLAANFGQRLEFNEGDLGLAGGIQLLEPATKNRATADTIYRFGGTSDPETPWPDVRSSEEEEEFRYDRLHSMLQKAVKKYMVHDDAEHRAKHHAIDNTTSHPTFFYSEAAGPQESKLSDLSQSARGVGGWTSGSEMGSAEGDVANG